MRRNNEKSKVPAYNSGRGITSQTLLYQHMSNHYRRILNAKKSVDTATPAAFKAKRKSTCSAPPSLVRGFTAPGKNFGARNASPALTERTASTCSNGVSCWCLETYYGRKCQNIGCHCRTRSEINHSNMELINQIAFDTKCGPANCFETDSKVYEPKTNFNQFRSPYEVKKGLSRNSASSIAKKTPVNKNKNPTAKRKLSQKVPTDLMEKHSKCFISHNISFRPRILKTDAASKVRTLRVYNPPKKKSASKRKKGEKEGETKISMEGVSDMNAKCGGVSVAGSEKRSNGCKCAKSGDLREPSQTSSRDSAYNGGVSSLPESRSPTPDQRRKSCCCMRKEKDVYYDERIIVPGLKLTDNQNTQTELSQICGRDVGKSECKKCGERISRAKDVDGEKGSRGGSNTSFGNLEDRDYFKRKLKEEVLYTNFIKDITAEVLEKGLYTNKALKRVMKRHVLSNLQVLDKGRMIKEIEKLRIQLGIPEDDDLTNIKIDSGGGSGADIEECYSIISDSQLTDGSGRKKSERKTSVKRKSSADLGLSPAFDGSETDKSMPKSISDIIYQTEEANGLGNDTDSDDEELISVIHVTKLVKEKKRTDSYGRDESSDPSRTCTRGNSADESEQSSDNVVRKKKLHTRFRKPEKASSSSDDNKPEEGNRRYGQGKALRSPNRKHTKPKSNEEVDNSEE